MNRRNFLCTVVVSLFPSVAYAQKRKLYSFRIKYQSKPKGSVTFTTIEAHDEEESKTKLRKRFPQCVILSVEKQK